ncbi:hypothetical protein CK203_050873 [Vitis vinifera]|uniref:Uncharacterized protein n=1 Tax=Vitis vinifera TaxID=29760 RepID=A0A438GQY4_VITVI|nr:hypothetical protein CK203_050873 [Vitis vinifera]
MPEVASSAPPATPGTPPVVPPYEPHPSESSVAISISEWRPYVHIRIILSPPKPSILPSLGRYSSIWVFYYHLSMICLAHQSLQIHPKDPPLAEQTMPPEETTIGHIEASIPSTQTSTAEPSSPYDPSTTI